MIAIKNFLYICWTGLLITSQPMAGVSWRESMQFLYGKTPGRKEITDFIWSKYGAAGGTAVIGLVLAGLWYTFFFKNVLGEKKAEEAEEIEKLKKSVEVELAELNAQVDELLKDPDNNVKAIVILLNKLYAEDSSSSFLKRIIPGAEDGPAAVSQAIINEDFDACKCLRNELIFLSPKNEKEKYAYRLINALIGIACKAKAAEEKKEEEEQGKRVDKLLMNPRDNINKIVDLLNNLYIGRQYPPAPFFYHMSASSLDALKNMIFEQNDFICFDLRQEKKALISRFTKNETKRKYAERLITALITITCNEDLTEIQKEKIQTALKNKDIKSILELLDELYRKFNSLIFSDTMMVKASLENVDKVQSLIFGHKKFFSSYLEKERDEIKKQLDGKPLQKPIVELINALIDICNS